MEELTLLVDHRSMSDVDTVTKQPQPLVYEVDKKLAVIGVRRENGSSHPHVGFGSGPNRFGDEPVDERGFVQGLLRQHATQYGDSRGDDGSMERRIR